MPPATQADSPRLLQFWVFQMVSVILGTLFISNRGLRDAGSSKSGSFEEFLADLDPNGTRAAGKQALFLPALCSPSRRCGVAQECSNSRSVVCRQELNDNQHTNLRIHGCLVPDRILLPLKPPELGGSSFSTLTSCAFLSASFNFNKVYVVAAFPLKTIT